MEELDKRLKAQQLPVVVNALHPGAVDSSITRHFAGTSVHVPWWAQWVLKRVFFGMCVEWVWIGFGVGWRGWSWGGGICVVSSGAFVSPINHGQACLAFFLLTHPPT